MSERLRRALLAWALAVLAFLPLDRGAAQTGATRADLESLAGPLYRDLAALKSVSSPGPPPPIQLKSRAEMRRFIEQELDRRYSAARVEAERKSMVAWGLIPANYDMRRLFLDLMEEQIAAYYDPRAKVMVVGDWLPTDQQQLALTHELVHALQDRAVSLDDFIAPRAGESDHLLARQALVEGEAVALTMDLMLRTQGLEFAALPDLAPIRGAVAAGSAGPAITAAPKFLRELLLFPYLDGLGFAHELRKARPWSAMAALYLDPPQSTSQILRPAKRLGAREDPIAVSLPDLASLAPGLRVIIEDELGEFSLAAVMAAHIGDGPARAAAAGWRGDRYRVLEDDGGTLAVAYLLALDSERGARTFVAGYRGVIERRYPAVAGKGAAAGSLTTWRAGGRAFAVEQRAAEVLVLEQMPESAADPVREAIWRARSGTPRK